MHSQEPTTCLCPEPDQSISPYHTYRRAIFILPSHLHLGLGSDLFPLRSPDQNFSCPPCPTSTHFPSNFSWFDDSNNIWCVQIMKLPQVSSYLVLLRPKFLFLHPFLKHLLPLILYWPCFLINYRIRPTRCTFFM